MTEYNNTELRALAKSRTTCWWTASGYVSSQKPVNELLNAMIELVVLWRKVAFAAPFRVADLPPSIGRTAGGAGRSRRGRPDAVWLARCVCSASFAAHTERDASDADASRFLPQSRPHRRS